MFGGLWRVWACLGREQKEQELMWCAAACCGQDSNCSTCRLGCKRFKQALLVPRLELADSCRCASLASGALSEGSVPVIMHAPGI
jgi:hypothetical protein